MAQHILFLDDDHRRIAQFRSITAKLPCEVTIVETADECIARLGERSFDVVLLDHDLGGETYCDSSREDCGMEVVRWLKKNRGEHGGFICHSMNAIAATTMYFELASMGYRVEQAVFGSSEFQHYLHDMLGMERKKRVARKKSLGDRFGEYIRSIRSKR